MLADAMLTALLLMMLVISVSAGNLALGFGLAVHLGHGPANGWAALCFWKPKLATPAGEAIPAESPNPHH